MPGAVRHARRAHDLSPADDHLCRASAAGLSGLAFWPSGDLEAGHSAYAAMVLLAARIWQAAARPASQPHLERASVAV